MFTSDLAEIVEIEGRLLSVKPLGKGEGVAAPVIHGVAIGLIGNINNYTDYNLKIGDIIPIWYTTRDISDYIAFGNKDTVGSSRRNNYNSAFTIPITFNYADLGLALPKSISFIGDRLDKGNVVHTGDHNVTGDYNLTGNMTISEKIIAKIGNVLETLGIKGIDFGTHKHTVSKPEHPSGTEKSSAPNKE